MGIVCFNYVIPEEGTCNSLHFFETWPVFDVWYNREGIWRLIGLHLTYVIDKDDKRTMNEYQMGGDDGKRIQGHAFMLVKGSYRKHLVYLVIHPFYKHRGRIYVNN